MEKTPELLRKIKELFDLRMIPWLLDVSAIENQDAFLDKLTSLQVAIYALDQHLETHWKLTRDDLKPFWSVIYDELEGFGLTDYHQRSWSSEIVRYQTRELALRDGISPALHAMEALYYYKSCDVRLMRNLIYRESHNIEQLLPFGSWHEFDLITEVNDDVEDIYEDLEILNGNRFLFSLLEFGMASTEERYLNFVDRQVEELRKRLSRAPSAQSKFILDATEAVAHETKTILLDRMKSLKPSIFVEARIVQEFKKVRELVS